MVTGIVFNEAPLAAFIFGEPVDCIMVPDFPRDIQKNALQGADGSYLFGADGIILQGAGA